MLAGRFSYVACTLLALALTSPSLAKGLDELSQANPDNEEKAQDEAAASEGQTKAEGSDKAVAPEGEGEAKVEGESAEAKPVMERSAASLAIEDKLFVGTSFGWVKASSSKGKWQSSGMSDVTVGYKVLPEISHAMTLLATYRYAPVAVTREVDERSLRGVLEMHYFGGRVNYTVNPNITALGTAEVGVVSVHMHDTDGLGDVSKYNAGGVSIALGGGADWGFGEKSKWSAGPRLNLGFGSFSTLQLGGAVGFMF